MTAMTGFVTELWRAANQVEKLTVFERRRLIERAVATIRDFREQGNLPPPTVKSTDEVLVQITQTAREIASTPDVLVAHSLFVAADIIRAIHVELAEKAGNLTSGDSAS